MLHPFRLLFAAISRVTDRQYGGLVPECLSMRLFLPDSQIAQFDCGVCAGEEADEARTDRDDPRRIDTGYNPDVDEPSLQHSTAERAIEAAMRLLQGSAA